MSLVALLLALASADVAATPAIPAAQVDAIFAHWNHADTPGCAIRVDEGGRTLVDRAYGSADLEHGVPIGRDTVFEAGSVSKQFTAAAILLLAEDGRLSLDDDVRRWIPDLPDYGAPIRIANLLHHTSGLRDWGDVVGLAGWPRGEATWTMADIRDVVIRQHGLDFAPGTEWNYSNSNFNLLAMIVEKASGMSFPRFTAERLFKPLGMASTGWRADYRTVVPHRAIAYSREQAGYEQAMPFEDSIGNGGLLTTTADLQRWNAALLANRIGRGVAERMRERAVLADGTRVSYGTGLFVTSHAGLAEHSHGGATGGYRAWVGIYPASGLSVALLCNAAEANATALAHAAADLALRPATPASAPRAVAGAERYAGVYVDRHDQVLRLTVRDGALDARPFGPLIPAGEGRFRTASGYEVRFASVDEVTVAGESGHDEFRRVIAPTGTDATPFAGRYVSADVGATYRVTPDGTAVRLVLETRPQTRFSARPIGTDIFLDEEDDMVVRFRRDARGAVDGLSITTSRAFAVPFARIGAGDASGAAPSAG